MKLTIKDLRIVKLGRRAKMQPCTQELDAYLSCLGMDGADGTMTKRLASFGKALSKCLEQRVSLLNVDFKRTKSNFL